MKTKNKIKRELERKELEFDLQQKIESDYRAKDKYLSSNRVLNFLTGMAISFALLAFINRFFLGGIASFYPLQEPYKFIITILQTALILVCGYMNMRAMGKFSNSVIEYLKSFLR